MREIITAFVVFAMAALLFRFILRKRNKSYGQNLQEYLMEDQAANFIRKREIPLHLFFHPDLNRLPARLGKLSQPTTLTKAQDDVVSKASAIMIHFVPPKTNLEIKHEFGFPNLDLITSYEENFDRYTIALNHWGDELLKAGELTDAETVLTEAIFIGSGLSKTFTLLADLYAAQHNRRKLEALWERVDSSDLMTKAATARYIKEKMEQLP